MSIVGNVPVTVETSGEPEREYHRSTVGIEVHTTGVSCRMSPCISSPTVPRQGVGGEGKVYQVGKGLQGRLEPRRTGTQRNRF